MTDRAEFRLFLHGRAEAFHVEACFVEKRKTDEFRVSAGFDDEHIVVPCGVSGEQHRFIVEKKIREIGYPRCESGHQDGKGNFRVTQGGVFLFDGVEPELAQVFITRCGRVCNRFSRRKAGKLVFQR